MIESSAVVDFLKRVAMAVQGQLARHPDGARQLPAGAHVYFAPALADRALDCRGQIITPADLVIAELPQVGSTGFQHLVSRHLVRPDGLGHRDHQ